MSIESFKSIIIKISALLAFVAINLIGYRAFSYEMPTEMTPQLATQIAPDRKQITKAQISSVPSCQIAPEGFVANKWKNIRIQIGNAIVSGAESLSDLSQQLKQLVVEHKCLPLPVPCSFASEGLAIGAWVKHRIVI